MARPSAVHGPDSIMEVVAALLEQGCEVAIKNTRATNRWRVTATSAPEGLDVAPLLEYTLLRLTPERERELNALLAELTQRGVAAQRSGDWGGYSHQEDAWFDRLLAFSAAAGQGVQPGKLLMWGVGDGKACYVVYEIHPRRVQLMHIPVGDAWQWPGVDANGCISREDAEQAALRADTPLFGPAPTVVPPTV